MRSSRFKIDRGWFSVIGIVLIVLSVILLVWFFLRGQTTVIGSWTEDKRVETMACSINGLIYPFFDYENSQRTTTRINVIFDDDKIASISLAYFQYYATEKESIDSENLNHIAMNVAFAKDNLGFDALGLKFSKFSNGLQMSLYAKGSQINNASGKFFLLDGLEDDAFTIAKIEPVYAARGFECKNNKEEHED